MKILSGILIALLSFSAIHCQSNPVNNPQYPSHWWQPISKDGAPAWEIMPQEAGPGEVILSKRNELGLLSNFAATAFELDGKTYASVEGFWQMLKYPEGPNDERLKNSQIKWPYTREQVSKMIAFEAKNAGKIASENMKKLKIDWVTYNGKKIIYHEPSKGDFYQLIVRAEWAKIQQNSNVKSVLLKTGNLKLRPDHIEEPDAAPAWKYYEIWMNIRSQLQI